MGSRNNRKAMSNGKSNGRSDGVTGGGPEGGTAGGAGVFTSLGHDPEMIADFVLEASEHVQAIEANSLRLERDACDTEAIHASFRAFHTVKGLAGFLDLEEIRDVAHEVETVLDRARNGELSITPPVIDVVLESADFLKRWLQKLAGGPLNGAAYDETPGRELIGRVRAALEAAPAAAVEAEAADNAVTVEPPLVLEQPEEPAEPAPVPLDAVAEELRVLAEAMPPLSTPPVRVAAPVANLRATPSRAVEARSVKVDTGKLDHLVDTVGEMVIAQSMIQHDPELGSINRPRLVRNLSQLARITNEVQKTAMSMRMVPVGQLFQRMARVVRDLTRKMGKQAELELIGEETELDRNLVEELADPLMHMLRNSVDHAIEPAEARMAAGKPAVARLRLAASHQSGNIVVEVSDDGAGLDRGRIIAKAIQNGIIAEGHTLTDTEVFNLIFQPGFSTAAQLTDVSGRGVGMDVVRRHVQKLRGRIEIQSVAGEGTTFLLKLPLTLAIVDGLIVGVGSERYIMPLFAVREMLRPSSDTIFRVQDKGEMALVRERLLPLVRLYEKFGVVPRSECPADSLLIVVESAVRPFAIIVDELIGKQEVVIKSLGPLLHNTPGIAGGAILGDGRVGLILDLDRVFQQGGTEHGRREN